MASDLRILMLEDVVDDSELIQRELRKAGLVYNARRVDTESGFLEALTDFKPDIILADYSLPAYTALAALSGLKKREINIPLVVVTGSQPEEIVVECIREGAEDYILKSSLTRLPQAIKNTLKRAEAERNREASDRALRKSEEQYRLITENTRDLICLLDVRDHFLYASPSYETVLGYLPKDLVGTDCFALIHPDDASNLRKTLEEAQFFKEQCKAQVHYQHQNGDWLAFEIAGNFSFDAHGKPERIVMVSRDVAERRRTEGEIQHLDAFPRFNPNPVLAFAADGSLTYCNDAAQAIARSLGKEHPRSILPLNTSAIVKMCLATGRNNLRMDTAYGGRTLSWSFYPIQASNVVHCYAEDVTARLNLEGQLRQSQRMESVGQLAAGVAHDFNNILTIIQGHSSLLLNNRKLDEDAIDSLRQVSVAAERAASLTRQLLMFSRKQLAQPRLMDLNDVINNVGTMLRVLMGEQISLRIHVGRNLPAISADAGMIEQVLMNLAVNSRDAMPNGGRLTLSTFDIDVEAAYVEMHPDARTGHFVCLSVGDTGVGMDAETLSRIFEPFFTTKDIGKGTGLGLATVYGIVKQHNGWIEVSSVKDQGTTFKIFLPVSAKAAESAYSSVEHTVRGGTETILVVEDEPALRELVLEILQHYGYTVYEAANSGQALGLCKEKRDQIDLLLTDMMMPESLSGRELAEKFIAENPRIKVIYTSGYPIEVLGPNVTIKEGLNFLQKPYHPQTLAQTVRDCLEA